MSNLFIDPNAFDRVYEDDTTQENVVMVRRKMGYGTRARLQNELYQFTMSDNSAAGKAEIKIGVQLQELLLLKYNVMEWQGPLFMKPKTKQVRAADGSMTTEEVTDRDGNTVMIPIHCTRENIELLDPGDPFVAKILKRISDNNTPRKLAAPEQSQPAGPVAIVANVTDNEGEEGDDPGPLD